MNNNFIKYLGVSFAILSTIVLGYTVYKNERVLLPNSTGTILEGISTDAENTDESDITVTPTLQITAVITPSIANTNVPVTVTPTATQGAVSGDTITNTDTKKETSIKTHIVKKGDTLWAIACKMYNNCYFWPKIRQANENKVRYLKSGEKALIYVGDELVLP